MENQEKSEKVEQKTSYQLWSHFWIIAFSLVRSEGALPLFPLLSNRGHGESFLRLKPEGREKFKKRIFLKQRVHTLHYSVSPPSVTVYFLYFSHFDLGRNIEGFWPSSRGGPIISEMLNQTIRRVTNRGSFS